MKFRITIIALGLCLFICGFTTPAYKLARLKYNGGGDWYGDRTALTNLIKFCNSNLHTNFSAEEETVEAGSAELFNYPYIFMTGHGNVVFSDLEVRNLRKYLTGGGFLHICDNYGLDQFIRPQMKKVFPELDFVELPLNHPIYHQKYEFATGLPKIHEHNDKRPQGFGLIYKGRLVCFYDYECDLGNGWEDYGTYAGDAQETRLKALKMGANLVQYALIQ
ncbi:DUF4159 domain-containing protein [Mucilaginibacter polytrichastri]|uniref:DUF4159 domain-containing protein n=1 Tax=Mucilaginibacter polytrichastri TaxID=1302689 RepID=A0A1Q6A634_9SPHI|nr:DUF4159 domain-containing protein [Mucilaginibacter polytrichastri]OKS89473.1 hypothetical protein RG47T_4957 [Mucilaginibacter polytrichastri]SFS71934.1 protein of unknown function [Mucilaginibacter polytrichastri]